MGESFGRKLKKDLFMIRSKIISGQKYQEEWDKIFSKDVREVKPGKTTYVVRDGKVMEKNDDIAEEEIGEDRSREE